MFTVSYISKNTTTFLYWFYLYMNCFYFTHRPTFLDLFISYLNVIVSKLAGMRFLKVLKYFQNVLPDSAAA